MTSLNSPLVSETLEGLYGEAKKTDSVVLPKVFAEAKRIGGSFDAPNVVSLLDDAFIPVSAEVGRFLYTLVRLRRPKIVVEFGASFGLSAIHIAAAIRDNGVGKLITTELNPNKVSCATENIKKAGLGDLVEVRQGDAFKTLADVTKIDFLLLDGWKGLYLSMLQKLEPFLSSGSPIVADDIKLFSEVLQPYLSYVRDPKNGYTSNEFSMDDGLELSLRR